MAQKKTGVLAVIVVLLLAVTITGGAAGVKSKKTQEAGTSTSVQRELELQKARREWEKNDEAQRKILEMHELRRQRLLARQAARKKKNLDASSEDAIELLIAKIDELEDRVELLEKVVLNPDPNELLPVSVAEKEQSIKK